MPSFTSVPFTEVAPKSRTQSTGVRKAAFLQVLGAVETLVGEDALHPSNGLQFTLEPTDKALTVLNQIRRAAAQLGIEVHARRKGDVIGVYKTGDVEPTPAPARRTRRTKAQMAEASA